MIPKQVQLTVFSVLAGLVSVASIVYVFVASPDYLKTTREGTPFFTPPVIDPTTGEALDVEELIRHYKSGG